MPHTIPASTNNTAAWKHNEEALMLPPRSKFEVTSYGKTQPRFWFQCQKFGKRAIGNVHYATDNSIGSMIDGSSFSGLLTRVEIGHIRVGSAGNGCMRSSGSGSSLSHRA